MFKGSSPPKKEIQIYVNGKGQVEKIRIKGEVKQYEKRDIRKIN